MRRTSLWERGIAGLQIAEHSAFVVAALAAVNELKHVHIKIVNNLNLGYSVFNPTLVGIF